MIDPVANPWGERTPFGPGEDWPVRVDQFLEEGASEEDETSAVSRHRRILLGGGKRGRRRAAQAGTVYGRISTI
jgi:hypothetical protein